MNHVLILYVFCFQNSYWDFPKFARSSERRIRTPQNLVFTTFEKKARTWLRTPQNLVFLNFFTELYATGLAHPNLIFWIVWAHSGCDWLRACVCVCILVYVCVFVIGNVCACVYTCHVYRMCFILCKVCVIKPWTHRLRFEVRLKKVKKCVSVCMCVCVWMWLAVSVCMCVCVWKWAAVTRMFRARIRKNQVSTG